MTGDGARGGARGADDAARGAADAARDAGGAAGKPRVGAAASVLLDEAWLNDRTAFQRNFVHGLRNPSGLRIQYHLEPAPQTGGVAAPVPDPLGGRRVVGTWTAGADHVGFPGVVHGGLVVAILDDAIGRCAALRHRWVVTGRLDVRFRSAARTGVPLRIEAWLLRWQRLAVTGRARLLLPDGGGVVAEARGTYLPVPDELLTSMVESWPGFAEYVGREGVPGPARPDGAGGAG